MATKLTKKHKELHSKIKADTQSAGFSMVDPTEVQSLVDAGLVETKPELKNGDGLVPAKTVDSAVSDAPVATKPQFEIVTVPIPEPSKRGGVREEIYPFSQLEVGQSFFIAATAAKPNPAESFASTVTSATRRFAQPTGNTKTNRKGKVVPETVVTRKFIIRAVTAGTEYPNGFKETANGARVIRTK